MITRPILITGSYGMLGTDLVQAFTEQFGAKQVIATDADILDITSENALEKAFEEMNPQVVINSAAYTNVDGAETDRQMALQINFHGPKNLARVCKKFNSKLVHFSTDYVFSGEKSSPWTEEDRKNPPTPNYYGVTKLKGETEVLSYKNSIMLRVQWLYGKKRERFSQLKKLKSFTPIVDQIGAPVWTREVAKTVLQLVQKDSIGLFHFAYDDWGSWLDVFQVVKEEWNLDIEFIPKKSEELRLPAKRPLYCALSNRKLCKELGIDGMGSWKPLLREFLRSL